MKTAGPFDSLTASDLPQYIFISWRALPLMLGRRTQMLAVPATASHSSISYASGLSSAEKRRSSPEAFDSAKLKEPLLSRTSTGKFSSDAVAGRFAPSGVVRMNIDPECCQSGYCAAASVGDNVSSDATRNKDLRRWYFIERFFVRFISCMLT